MAYFSNTEEQPMGGWFGCGPECSCGPCRSGVHGFSERYELEEEDEQPPAGARPASLNGWYGAGLSHYGFDETEAPAPVPQTPTPQTTPPPQESTPPIAPQSGTQQSNAQAQAPAPTETPRPSPPTISPEAEEELIQDALRNGVRNPWQLVDIVFFARHPNRKGSPIKPEETDLITERRHIRVSMVLPALRQLMSFRRPQIRRIVRPQRVRRFARFGFAGVPTPPVCGAARADLATIAGDLTLINNELAKGSGASAYRLSLKRQLLDLDVDGMIRALDSYIATGCCEPSLKTLESEVKALPWHVTVVPTLSKLLTEVTAAQGRAKKDLKHC
jgi:hypothetical protein